MSETQAEYTVETTDALEMLGAGYDDDHPSIEIQAPRTAIERRGRQMVEVDYPAFVKISTNFKAELGDIDSDALKVWLYIALSINRNTETAYPGLRKIHEDTHLAINTVRAAVDRLENKYNLLVVTRDGTRKTVYRTADYVSANTRKTVSPGDTDSETVSSFDETVSKNMQTVSAPRQETAQPDNQKNQNKRGDLIDAYRDLYEMPGAKKSVIKEYISSQIKVRLALNPSGRDAENFINYAADRKIKDGQEIDAFIDWWIVSFQQRAYWSFAKMEQNWPAAFALNVTGQLQAASRLI